MVIIPVVEVDDGRLADICDRYGIAELEIFAHKRISRRGRSQRPRRSVTAVPEAVGLVADFAGVRDRSIRKSAPTWLWSHAADLTAGQTRVRR